MNRTAHIRLTGLNIPYLKENIGHIVLTILALASLLCGACSLLSVDFYARAEELFGSFISARKEVKFISAFGLALFTALRTLIISYLGGTSATGLVISPSVFLYECFNYGAFSGYVYKVYGLSGIVFNLFVLLLPSLVRIFSLLISAKESVGFSRKIALACIKDSRPVNLYRDFRQFCFKHLVLTVPVIISAFLDVSLYNMFSNYFKF